MSVADLIETIEAATKAQASQTHFHRNLMADHMERFALGFQASHSVSTSIVRCRSSAKKRVSHGSMLDGNSRAIACIHSGSDDRGEIGTLQTLTAFQLLPNQLQGRIEELTSFRRSKRLVWPLNLLGEKPANRKRTEWTV